MRRPIALVCAGLAVAAAGGCGASEVKRTVDPRTEALRFFAAGTEAVVLVRLEQEEALAELAAMAKRLPGLGIAERRLRLAGLTPAALRELLVEVSVDDDIPPPELAIGATRLEDLDSGATLVTLATEQTDLLEEMLEDNAANGAFERTGTLHDAILYRGPDAAFAIRDGVLLAARDVAQLEQAIEIRDGDRDQHIDDRRVDDALEEVAEDAPLHAYLDLEQIVDASAELSRLAATEPWIDALGPGAAAVHPGPAGVVIDFFAEAGEADVSEDERPFPEEPTRFGIAPGALPEALRGGGVLGRLISALAPFSGRGSATADEVRVRLVLR